jgi:membrane dipeptidase
MYIVTERAKALLNDMIVWDNVWPWEPWCGNSVDNLRLLAEAGWTHISLTVAGDMYNISETVSRIGALRREVQAEPDRFILVNNVDDITEAKRTNRLAVSLHLEGTRCLERNIDMVEVFYLLGIRHNLLAFNSPNSAGGGCAEPDPGLSGFGKRVVAEMERVGMLLDLSHTGYKTTMDAMEMATRPVVFTHSNSNTLTPHWRNLKDDQIKACAATGGLVGISGSNDYLGDPDASTEALFRHLDYYVNLVGPDHVGFGFDIVFNADPLNEWVKTRPKEWPGVDSPDWNGFSYMEPHQLHGLIEMMLNHGYDEAAIRKISGENYIRICNTVWK